MENWIKAAAGSIALKRGEPVGAALNFHKSFFTRQANVVNGTNKSLRRNRRDFRSENAPYLKTLARDAVLLRNANSIYQATTQDIFVQRTFPIITRVERSWPCYSGQVYMACCRFHGHRVKVFLLKPESMNAKTNIQPRVQA
ncbi:hypothetical protein [Rhizobium sp. IY2]|uniref:hypothetical protein n=1 Tax=Rhizobium sp. IY2 TaxID=3397853 RepID=UPI0039DF4D45